MPTLQTISSSDEETDLLRLNDLARLHCLDFRKIRRTYVFEDYTAHGLKQALGFVEGFDRAKCRAENS